MNNFFHFSLIILTFLFVQESRLFAKVFYASSGNVGDIQSAVDLTANGDTVMIPAGTFTFNSQQVIINKSIALLGAGADKTILKNQTYWGEWKAMIQVNCITGKPFHFANMTLEGTGNTNNLDMGLYIKGDCKDIRVHHSIIKGFPHAGVTTRGLNDGVIDHNKFVDNQRSGRGYGVQVLGASDRNWNRPLELGSKDAIFIEDNLCTGTRHCVESNDGGQYVYRYNTLTDNAKDAAHIDAHGKRSYPRGARSYEVYENVINNSVRRFQGCGMRGGDGVIFNNTINNVKEPIALWTGGGTTNCNNVWPCPDQIRALYIWNNTHDGNPAIVTTSYSGGYKLVKQDRDYFLYKLPGYTPYVYPHPLVDDGSLRIVVSQLPSATNGIAYSFTLSGSGGKAPYSWNLTAGALPTGISLSASGLISGNTTQEGDYDITIQIKDADNKTAVWNFTLNVVAPLSPPTNLIAAKVSGIKVDLTWDKSTNTQALYRVYRDGQELANVTINSYNDITVCPGNTYAYQVLAFENVNGSTSAKTAALNVTTSVLTASDNLANNCTHIADSKNFDTNNPVTGLWDGNLSGEAANSPGTSADGTIWIEFDLTGIYSLNKIRVFGDAVGNWVCKTYAVEGKISAADNYATILSGEDCFGDQWFENVISVDAQFIKLTVTGDLSLNKSQIREFEVLGSSKGTTVAMEFNDGRKNNLVLMNGPNPFSQATNLLYRVPANSAKQRVQVLVFSNTGEQVITLINQSQGSGEHTIAWQGRDHRDKQLPNGVYFVSLIVGKHKVNKKILLIK